MHDLAPAEDATAMSETLIELCRHNAWANEQVFDACEGLSDAQLDAAIPGAFGSIRNTLMHIAGAQGRFAAALGETGPVEVICERGPFPGLAELRDCARTSGDVLIEVAVRAQSGATVTTTWLGEVYSLPVWMLLAQALIHAAEHRTQVAAILAQQGVESPAIDVWSYHEDRFGADWSRLWSS